MSYTITLSAEDIRTIAWVGPRYCWSTWACRRLSEGANTLAEHEAWDFKEAIQADMEGNHAPFPLLNPSSELYQRLMAFLDSIV